MFGADTSLVVDAIQIGLVALGAGVVGTLLFRRHKRAGAKRSAALSAEPAGRASASLENRVRVLERIATDSSVDLANEIESLRDTEKKEHA